MSTLGDALRIGFLGNPCSVRLDEGCIIRRARGVRRATADKIESCCGDVRWEAGNLIGRLRVTRCSLSHKLRSDGVRSRLWQRDVLFWQKFWCHENMRHCLKCWREGHSFLPRNSAVRAASLRTNIGEHVMSTERKTDGIRAAFLDGDPMTGCLSEVRIGPRSTGIIGWRTSANQAETGFRNVSSSTDHAVDDFADARSHTDRRSLARGNNHVRNRAERLREGDIFVERLRAESVGPRVVTLRGLHVSALLNVTHASCFDLADARATITGELVAVVALLAVLRLEGPVSTRGPTGTACQALRAIRTRGTRRALNLASRRTLVSRNEISVVALLTELLLQRAVAATWETEAALRTNHSVETHRSGRAFHDARCGTFVAIQQISIVALLTVLRLKNLISTRICARAARQADRAIRTRGSRRALDLTRR